MINVGICADKLTSVSVHIVRRWEFCTDLRTSRYSLLYIYLTSLVPRLLLNLVHEDDYFFQIIILLVTVILLTLALCMVNQLIPVHTATVTSGIVVTMALMVTVAIVHFTLNLFWNGEFLLKQYILYTNMTSHAKTILWKNACMDWWINQK